MSAPPLVHLHYRRPPDRLQVHVQPLVHDAPETSFLQPGLLAIGWFATVGVTGWLAQRVAANERLARQRGRELATQRRVSELVIGDMHDGVAVLVRDGKR